jgi:SAM-dependent methyltransferase
MTDDDLRARILAAPFFQRYELAGVMTPGRHDIGWLLRRIELPDDLTNLDVLDCGANDGALSWESERRGAASVISADHPDWAVAGHGWAQHTPYDLAHEITGSKAEKVVMDFDRPPDEWPIAGRAFDLILYCGVHYHLKTPLKALEGICDLLTVGGQLIVETHVAALDVPYPAARLYPDGELVGDRTNHSGWNVPAWLGYLGRFGLEARQVGDTLMCNAGNHRAVFHARRPG